MVLLDGEAALRSLKKAACKRAFMQWSPGLTSNKAVELMQAINAFACMHRNANSQKTCSTRLIQPLKVVEI